MPTILCNVSSDGLTIFCNGTEYDEKVGPLTVHDVEFWLFLSLYCVLVLFAGLMSGLTLGLLSLDMTSLRVLQEAGTPKERKFATKIVPLVKRHHLLLVTLLLANAAAVETMPVFLDRISDPVTAILVSVTAVLLFGEVFPQALCSRYGLAIGAYLSPVVYFLMAVSFVISYPLSKLLDCMLGRDHATFFRRAELKALVDLHGPAGIQGNEELTYDEVLIIKGALELRDKTVHDAMVPLENVFMLDIETKLDSSTIAEMLRVAHSRIPIFEACRENVVGILLVKTLAFHTPTDQATVRTMMKDKRVSRRLHLVTDTTPLYDLLNSFQKGKTHLAVVTLHRPSNAVDGYEVVMRDHASDSGEVIGIITLEDILEELLQEEIIDETDVYVDVRNRVKVARAKAFLGRSSSTQDFLVSRSTATMDTISSNIHPSSSRAPKRYLSIPYTESDGYHDNNRHTSHVHPGDPDSDVTPLLHDLR